mgnify:CR=1 FL=1
MTKGYHVDLAIRNGEDEEANDVSTGDFVEVGDNPERSAQANEHARQLRAYLAEFTSEAERIKGRINGEEDRRARWNRHLVMSDDLAVIEMHEDGKALDITTVIRMANTTGMDAQEAGEATTHSCDSCGVSCLHLSGTILMGISEGRHAIFCRPCYSNVCTDDV